MGRSNPTQTFDFGLAVDQYSFVIHLPSSIVDCVRQPLRLVCIDEICAVLAESTEYGPRQYQVQRLVGDEFVDLYEQESVEGRS